MNFINFKQAGKTSFKALRANKARSFLTMLGIIIGVASVIIIMSIGSGAQSLILGQLESMGSNLISITPGKSDEKGPPSSVFGIIITSLTWDDFKTIEKNKDRLGVLTATAYVGGKADVSFKNTSLNVSLEGFSDSYLEASGAELAVGRFFTAEENDNLAKLAVLGSEIKKELFGDSEAVGKRIKIKQQIFEVIGVLSERGGVAFTNNDNTVFIPVKTMQKNIVGINYLNNINVKARDDFAVDDVIYNLETILRDNHGINDQSGASDDFSVRSLSDLLEMIRTVTNALNYFLALMAGLSLIVGGIGIMNIMLISVNERTREIGLRKAIGASNKNIISQFLIEAITLTVIGGLLGIILGIFISWLIALIMNSLSYTWVFVVSPLSVFLAIFISALVGLIFGIYPAKKASKLEPVQALSYE